LAQTLHIKRILETMHRLNKKEMILYRIDISLWKSKRRLIMSIIMAFCVVLVVLAIGDVISAKTKAFIPSVFGLFFLKI